MTKGTVASNNGHVITIDAETDYQRGTTVWITNDAIEGNVQIKLHVLASTVSDLEERLEKEIKEHAADKEKDGAEKRMYQNQIVGLLKKSENK